LNIFSTVIFNARAIFPTLANEMFCFPPFDPAEQVEKDKH